MNAGGCAAAPRDRASSSFANSASPFVGSAGSRPLVSLPSCTVIFGTRGLSLRPDGDTGCGALATAARFLRGGVAGEAGSSLLLLLAAAAAGAAAGAVEGAAAGAHSQLSSHRHVFANAPTRTDGCTAAAGAAAGAILCLGVVSLARLDLLRLPLRQRGVALRLHVLHGHRARAHRCGGGTVGGRAPREFPKLGAFVRISDCPDVRLTRLELPPFARTASIF